jgi:hypothetical protein
MSSRHQRRADDAAFRRRGDDLLVDLFEAGTSLHGRPRAGLTRRTLAYWDKGSYSRASRHQCFVCGWHFRSRARLAGAFLIAVRASDPRPTDAAVGAVCSECWVGPNSRSLPEIEVAAITLLRAVCPGGSFQPQPPEFAPCTARNRS